MPLRIVRKPLAADDVFEIWAYIALDSLRAADRTVDDFDEHFRILSIHPNLGVERPELGGGLRSFPVGRFVIFYRHDRTTLDIVRVLGAARKLSNDLFET